MLIDAIRLRLSCLSLLVAVTVLHSAGCAPLKSGAHAYPDAPFERYTRFAWIAEDPWIVSGDDAVELSPLTRRLIADSIRRHLEQRGCQFATEPAQADFVVGYTIGARDLMTVSSYPVRYQGDWDWFPHDPDVPHRGFRYHSYTEGTLGVDVFDVGTGRPVWHGWATKRILTIDREDPAPVIDSAVAAIVERFPVCATRATDHAGQTPMH